MRMNSSSRTPSSTMRLCLAGRWLISLLLLLAATPTAAPAQCELTWRSMADIYGPGRDITHAVRFDDGSGPKVFAALYHYYISGPLTPALATWDGHVWMRVPGCDVDNFIHAMTVYQGEIIFGGMFRNIGGVSVNYIAAFDGRNWRSLGAGFDAPVYSLAVYRGELVAGGMFHDSGGTPLPYVAAWNGSSWRPAGSGLDVLNSPGVSELCIHNDVLYATGAFATGGGRTLNGLAAWDGGGSWMPVGSPAGLSGSVYALTSTPSGLVIAGGITAAGGVPVKGVCLFDGLTFRALGEISDTYRDSISTLVWHNGALYGGGRLSRRSDSFLAPLVRWTGTQWVPAAAPDWPTPSCLFPHEGRLLVLGGSPQNLNPGAFSAAAWDNQGGAALGDGISGPIHCTTDFRHEFVVGGEFTMADGSFARGIAVRRNDRWQPLGGGITESHNRPMVLAAASYGDRLVIGGLFDRAGQTACRNIAQWDGSQWSPLGPAAGADSWVQQLVVFGDSLYARGIFGSVGGIPASRLARWNGQAWSALPPLTQAGFGSVAVDTLCVFRDRLIVGGTFAGAQGVASAGVIAWDGTAWSSLAGGVTPSYYPIRNLTVVNDRLIAGGFFDGFVNTPARYVASWDGARWSAFAQPFPATVNGITSMGAYRGHLYIAGDFQPPSGPSVQLYRWDGISWAALSPGLSSSASNMRELDGGLFFGGTFGLSEGTWVTSGRLLSPPPPFISDQPDDAYAAPGGDAQFSVVSSGNNPVSTQWRRNFVPLVDSPPRIQGSQSTTLTISDIQPDDLARYDAVITDACGMVVSHGATLSTPCIADFDRGGGVDGSDVEAFFTAWESADPTADVDYSGGIDGADVETFFRAWESGC